MLRRPMKGCEVPTAIIGGVNIPDFSYVKFPCMVSPKLDGIRATTGNHIVLSSSMKPLPNRFMQHVLRDLPPGLDGELGVGSPTDLGFFKATSSGIMSEDGEPDFKFYVFDKYGKEGFLDRLMNSAEITHPYVVPLKHELIISEDHLNLKYREYLDDGYEGMMIRAVNGPYKEGKSTPNEGWLFKLKPFKDSEAKVLRWFPLMKNNNEPKTNELGRTARASNKANKEPLEAIGGFEVQDIYSDIIFHVGSGLTKEEGIEFWKIRDLLIDKIIKYKYFSIGDYEKPRHPTFEGFRDPMDLTNY